MKIKNDSNIFFQNSVISNKSLKLYTHTHTHTHTQLVGGELKSIIAESGRSMVEMIGTLAIIGVLSVATGLGIKYLLDKNTANQIMKDAHLGYISTPISSCVNDFISVEFSPISGHQTDFYCDPKNERYIRVSGISDTVCEHLLKMQSDNEVELYAYDEYTAPLCDKEENDLIFAFADTGFPAIPCTGINDCPPDFFGICHETDKLCLKCPEGQMPNTAHTQCVDLQCNEETETLCDNGRAKWCCPNTEICSTTAGECIKSDGMCSAIFNVSEIKRVHDCAYKVVSYTRSDGLETIDLSEVKSCDNETYYCYLSYSDETCSTTASSWSDGMVLYGTCAPMSAAYDGCTETGDRENVLQEIKPCPSAQYCYLKYSDDQCTSASSNLDLLYGVCLPMNSNKAVCPVSSGN